jgi:hypothetical protein
MAKPLVYCTHCGVVVHFDSQYKKSGFLHGLRENVRVIRCPICTLPITEDQVEKEAAVEINK